MVEGIAAVAIVFTLFLVMAQAATALIAHRTAQGAVAAAAARSALGVPLGPERARLATDIGSTVPGATDVVTSITTSGVVVRVLARFTFVPPGPLLRPIHMEVVADVPVAVDP